MNKQKLIIVIIDYINIIYVYRNELLKKFEIYNKLIICKKII